MQQIAAKYGIDISDLNIKINDRVAGICGLTKEDGSILPPNCGNRTLRLVFTGDLSRGIGYAAFWCDTCLEGIHISRAPIPVGAVVRLIDQDPADRRPQIPDYRVVN